MAGRLEVMAVMALYKQVCKDMHRNTKLSKIKSLVTVSYISPSAINPT
jgi:hypothetical protein